MKCYDIPRGNGKTLDDIIIELEAKREYVQRKWFGDRIDDLKELRKAMEELE